MRTLRKALSIFALVVVGAFTHQAQAQSQNDCSAFTFTFTGDATQTGQPNLSTANPCVNWRVTYSVTGTLTSTVTFQTSPDNTNWTSVPNTLCNSAVQPPCVFQGTNPLTGTTQGMGYFAAYGAYVRVITTASAGVGTGTIRIYGAKGATANAGTGTGGGTVTSVGLLGTTNQITVTGASPITGAGSWTLSFPVGGVTLPATTTGTFSGNLTGNASGSAATITGALVLANTPLTARGDLLIATTAAPILGKLAKGTQYQTLQGGATDPLYDAVHLDQATAITGILPLGNGGTGAATLAGAGIVAGAGALSTVNLIPKITASGILGQSVLSEDGTSVTDTAARNWGIGTWARTGNTALGKELVVWGGDAVVGDPSVLGTESLTNGALTAGTSWAVTGDFALTANEAIYTHFAGSGTLTQTSANLAVAGVGNRWYKFTYTLTVVLAGVTGCSITNAFADTAFGTAFDITAGVAKVFYFKSATTPGNFVISCTSAAGEIILDGLSLKEVQGGNSVVYGRITGGGTAGIKVLSNGMLGVGTDTPDSLFTMSANTATLPAPDAGTVLHIGGADSTNSTLNFDAFSGLAVVELRRANGTAASRSALANGNLITQIGFHGYGATGYISGAKAYIRSNAAENWTDSAAGTDISFGTTLIGTVITSEAMRIINNGSLGIGTSAPVYNLDVSKGVGLTGTARFFDQTATTGATLVTITPGAAQTSASVTLANGGSETVAGQFQVAATGVLQQLPRTTDPTCAAVGDIGKIWFDNTTTTTARKACNNVSGTLTWVAF